MSEFEVGGPGPGIRLAVRRWAAVLVLTLALAGCGGDDSGGPAPGVVRQGETLVRPGSDLVLVLPADLPASVTQETLSRVFLAVEAEPRCQNGAGSPTPFLLAQACLEFHRLYLGLASLPEALDGFADVAAYVDFLQLGDDSREADPYVAFFPAASFQEVVTPRISGARAIIGLRLEVAGGDVVGAGTPLTVREVLPFTRAWYDGIRVGDRIVGVDGRPLDGLGLAHVLELLPSEEGQGVTLDLLRGDVPVSVRTGAEEHIAFRVADGVAYLSVRRYTSLTGVRVREDVETLMAEPEGPPSRFILDLRGNGGGSVTGALALTDYLIDQDEPPGTNRIMTFADRDGRTEDRFLGGFPTSFAVGAPQNLSGLTRATFAVLVDGGSASASEITVAALQRYGRAQVVGTRTFGKAVRQDVVTLLDGSGLFIPSRRILDPAGVSWDRVGLVPDLVVDAQATQDLDPQLQAAIQALTAGSVAASRSAAARPGPEARKDVDPWLRLLSPAYR